MKRGSPDRRADSGAPAPNRQELLRAEWASLGSLELSLMLEDRLGGPGQSDGEHIAYLPSGGKDARVAIHFEGNSITSIQAGPAFDADQWSALSRDIDMLLATPPIKTGRAFAFSAYRVTASWRGEQSGIQILPPPAGAPLVAQGSGEHPFVLEFPIHDDGSWRVLHIRRSRESRKLGLLLNMLLVGHIKTEDTRLIEHVWAAVPHEGGPKSEWVQRSYIADLGQPIADHPSPVVNEPIEVLPAEIYYERSGNDGNALRIPSDLDESICRYRRLPSELLAKFDRALYWLDQASRQWSISMSTCYASLVSAIESLTTRGVTHQVYCSDCRDNRRHEVPGPTALFKDFLENHAPGQSQRKRRDQMYQLRSLILHGNGLMSYDEGRSIGWDPPWMIQVRLHGELWTTTRIALRNWLREKTS